MKVKVAVSEKTISRLFTGVCILCPILWPYMWKGIELSAWCLLALDAVLLWKILKQNAKIRVLWQITPVVAVLLCHLIYIVATGGNILGMSHYLFYTMTVFLLYPCFFDKEFAVRLYKATVIAACAFALIQFFVAEFFGYYISGCFRNSIAYAYAEELNGGMLAAGATVRPRSFFGEPSDFGAYVGIYLILLLVAKKKLERKDVVCVALASLGMICTRSSTGILLMLAGWGGYAVKNIIANKYRKINTLLLLLMLVGGIAFMSTDTFALFVQRTFELSTQPGGTMGRIGGYSLLFDSSGTSLLQLIAGHSLMPITTFMPCWLAILWYFGIVGLGAYIWVIRSLYKMAVNNEQRWICLLIVGMGFFLGVFFFMNEPFYYAVYFAFGGVSAKGVRGNE